MGDQTLYMRADMVEEAWRVVQPVLDVWAADNADINTYMSGGAGPLEADGLLARSGNFAWRTIEVAAKRQS
jgi:glucose-6-phosphate 1-dehydrogenase